MYSAKESLHVYHLSADHSGSSILFLLIFLSRECWHVKQLYLKMAAQNQKFVCVYVVLFFSQKVVKIVAFYMKKNLNNLRNFDVPNIWQRNLKTNLYSKNDVH